MFAKGYEESINSFFFFHFFSFLFFLRCSKGIWGLRCDILLWCLSGSLSSTIGSVLTCFEEFMVLLQKC